MNRRLIYIPTFFQPEYTDFYYSHHKNGESLSASTFSLSICKGLSSITKDMQIINIPPIGQYPLNYDRFFSIGGHTTINGVDVDSIKFSSIYLYQHYSLYWNLKKKLAKQIRPNEKYVFLFYALIEPKILQATISYCEKNKVDAKYVLIIPDFVEDINKNGTWLRRLKSRLYHEQLNAIYKKMNGFVFLTENMKERLPVSRPYVVVEGMYDTSVEREKTDCHDGLKRIFYSGMLHEKFGVKKLIDAFLQIEDDSLRLELCGSGDQEEYIKTCALKDSRIQYKGVVTHDKVLEMQAGAFLLVNPRSSEGEFTKYSFPSKTMEYLASGTPTLIYQLEGIPKEYYDYCFSIKDNQQDIGVLSDALVKICAMDTKELGFKAMKAKSFIYQNKSAAAQCSKILDLMEEI